MNVKKRLVIFYTTIFVFICVAYCVFFASYRPHLEHSIGCYYRYQYFDDNDKLCKDTVELTTGDISELIKILDVNCYKWSFDREIGFTEHYCLEFVNNDGEIKRLQIKYGGPGVLRLNNHNYVYYLDYCDAEKFFSIIRRYHRFKNVLIGG